MSHEANEEGWSPQGPVVELSDLASWQLLASRNFGHLGVTHNDQPEIFPVNYYSDERSILFRTAEGEKLHDLLHNRHVAFEADDDNQDRVWSVVVKGRATVLGSNPILSAQAIGGFPPWVPTEPFVYVTIDPESIRGRLFEHHVPIGRY